MPRPSLEVPFLLPDAPAEPDLVAKYFKVLSDATRVRVLQLLDEHGELSVGELVQRLGESQPNVSNHLACLRGCGIVVAEPEGRQTRYEIADPHLTAALNALVDVTFAVDEAVPCTDLACTVPGCCDDTR